MVLPGPSVLGLPGVCTPPAPGGINPMEGSMTDEQPQRDGDAPAPEPVIGGEAPSPLDPIPVPQDEKPPEEDIPEPPPPEAEVESPPPGGPAETPTLTPPGAAPAPPAGLTGLPHEQVLQRVEDLRGQRLDDGLI